MGSSEVLFIGGRSGVGKSTVALEVHAQLSARDVRHCVIEGDNLDLAHPSPHEHRLVELNLAVMWHNYRAIGYDRLVYVNTASVLTASTLVAAMGDTPRVTAVLLTATDATARARLAGREIGSTLDHHISRSDAMSRTLAEDAAGWVHRVAADGRSVVDVAAEVIRLTGWLTSSTIAVADTDE